MTDVPAFVRTYLASIGARASPGPGGAISVAWPSSHAAGFGPVHALAFDPDVAEAARAELCVPGSDVLDRILADASSRGLHCVARVDGAAGPPPEEVLAANLTFPNATPVVLGADRGVVPYVLFNFRVTIETDERRELLRSLLLNAETREEHRVSEAFLAESLAPAEEPFVPGADLADAYRAGCLALERAIRADVEAVRAQAAALLAEELARIEGFYDASIEELYEGRSREPIEAERALRAERERRVEEARRKHALTVRARLVNARTILIPTTTVRVRVANGRARTDLGLEYDAVSLETNRPRCASCGEATPVVHLCRRGHLACESCRQTCSFCDDAACRACAPTLIATCGACVRPLCPDHTYLDEIGRRPYCGEHATTCAICSRTVGPAYLATCGLCLQRYCSICVAGSERCETCRGLAEVPRDDPNVVAALATPGAPRSASRFLSGSNGRVTVVVARGKVFEQVFVLDRAGRVVHRRKGSGLVRR